MTNLPKESINDRVVNADSTKGYPKSKNQVGLAHEFLHALNNMRGNNAGDRPTSSLDPDDQGQSRTISREELNVRPNENVIRGEQKWKSRQINPGQ